MTKLLDCKETFSTSNNILEPTPNRFKEGQLFVDRLDDVEFSFVYTLRYIDPNSIDYVEKNTSEDHVRAWPTTQRYTEWFRAGIEPMPITVVFQATQNKFMTTNRRRLIASREAGVKKLPALIEIGRWRDLRFSLV